MLLTKHVGLALVEQRLLSKGYCMIIVPTDDRAQFPSSALNGRKSPSFKTLGASWRAITCAGEQTAWRITAVVPATPDDWSSTTKRSGVYGQSQGMFAATQAGMVFWIRGELKIILSLRIAPMTLRRRYNSIGGGCAAPP